MSPTRASGPTASAGALVVAHPAQPPFFCTDAASTTFMLEGASPGAGVATGFFSSSASAQTGHAFWTRVVASASLLFALAHRSPGSSAQSLSVACFIESSARHARAQSLASACA